MWIDFLYFNLYYFTLTRGRWMATDKSIKSIYKHLRIPLLSSSNSWTIIIIFTILWVNNFMPWVHQEELWYVNLFLFLILGTYKQEKGSKIIWKRCFRRLMGCPRRFYWSLIKEESVSLSLDGFKRRIISVGGALAFSRVFSVFQTSALRRSSWRGECSGNVHCG